ncbi:Alpha/Beta hydrolase protein [Aspergillus crustosus]
MPSNPFRIAVPDADLERLHQKLDATSFPDELDNAGWDMGVPLEHVKRLAAYWRNGFNWREQEQRMNAQFNQYTVPISVDDFENIDLHYLHHTSKTTGAIPLLFIHGWPGNFIEATKIIPLLTNGDENNPVFDVVAPSLPNFGFSSAIRKRGFGLKQYAEVLHTLMLALGYKEYEHIRAIHVNFIPMRFPMPWENPRFFVQNLLTIPFSAERKAYLSTTIGYFTKGSGYMIQQATRLQTLGYALHDSPVAPLTWIYDKLHLWTDNYPWTDDEILIWVSIYLFSVAGPTASTRIYYETSEDGSLVESVSRPAPRGVKVGVAQFKNGLMRYPPSRTQLLGYDVRVKEYPRGGHFAAWEAPDLLVGDLKEFLGKDGLAYGVIVGRNGFE